MAVILSTLLILGLAATPAPATPSTSGAVHSDQRSEARCAVLHQPHCRLVINSKQYAASRRSGDRCPSVNRPAKKLPMTPTFNSRHSRTTSGIGAEMTSRHNGCGRSRYGALDEPFRAFQSWFMRISCDRWGKDRMLNEAHTLSDKITIRAIIARLRWRGRAGGVAHRDRGAQQPTGV